MSTSSHAHRARRSSVLGRLLASRTRALLSLGLVLPMGFTGTLAAWTDSATLTGTSLASGSIDVQINNLENATSATLSMSAMVPGNSSAEVFTLKNNGLSPLKWSLTGGLTGTNASDYNSAIPNGLKLTVRDGGSKSGTGNTSTCTGGTALFTDTSLTSTTTTSLLSGQGPLAAAGTKSLCFQITFDSNAASSMQNKTASATFTFTGTSDLT